MSSSKSAPFLQPPHNRFSPKLISLYLVREIRTPFFVSLFVFTGVLFLIRSLKLIDLLINKSIPALDIVVLFSYIVPRFLEVAIPMSLLIGIIFGFGRLSADSELVVMRATGISLRQLVRPLAALSIVTALATLGMSLWLRPYANYKLGIGMFEVAKARLTTGIVPGVFNDFGTLTIYTEKFEAVGDRAGGGVLRNTIISDRRNPAVKRVFIAKNGEIVADNDSRSLNLRLFDGLIREGSNLDYNITYFDRNSVSLPESELLEENPAKGGKKSDEMYLGELLTAIGSKASADLSDPQTAHRFARYEVELHRRFVVPVSCLAVAIVAMALGIQPSRSGQAWGHAMNIGVGIAVILLYYLLLAFASALGEQQVAPIPLIMWVPNLLFVALAWFLFRGMESERWMAVSQALGSWIHSLSARLIAWWQSD